MSQQPVPSRHFVVKFHATGLNQSIFLLCQSIVVLGRLKPELSTSFKIEFEKETFDWHRFVGHWWELTVLVLCLREKMPLLLYLDNTKNVNAARYECK